MYTNNKISINISLIIHNKIRIEILSNIYMYIMQIIGNIIVHLQLRSPDTKTKSQDMHENIIWQTLIAV